MATGPEIENIANFVRQSYEYVIRVLERQTLFTVPVRNSVAALAEMMNQEADILVGAPSRSLEAAMRNPAVRRSTNLDRVGLTRESLLLKLGVARDFMNRQLTRTQVRRALEVAIAILESLQKAFGLIIEPLVEAYKLAKALL